MAKMTTEGTVLSDDGEWEWEPDGGVLGAGSWTRIAPAKRRPSLLTRLLVKKAAWGKPRLRESREADKLLPSHASRLLDAKADELRTEADRRRRAQG